MGSPVLVDISGLGRLPKYFEQKFDGVDLRNGEGVNGHHEGRVSLACGEEEYGFNDDFDVYGWQTKTGYELKVVIDSEVRVGLYTKGWVSFRYDAGNKQWRMSGTVYDRQVKGNREWEFCDAGSVVDLIAGGLACFEAAQTDQNLKNAARAIGESIWSDKNALEMSAAKYQKADDCAEIPENSDSVLSLPMPD